MPRRISDYPDAFAGWNLISSYGSLISVVATFIFLDVLYTQLTIGKESSRYPWLTPQFYSDILRAMLERAYDSLEWGLNSPPKPHSFVSLPLQSFHISPLLFATNGIPNAGPSPDDLARANLLIAARNKLQIEDDAMRKLSDDYIAAQEKADNAAGTPEGVQAALDSDIAHAVYTDAHEKYLATFQVIKDLIDLVI